VVKLMDFGIAKAEGVQLTRVGFTLGTPYYMPPEQVLGKPLTPQADVYAFGILLYELVTGFRPVKDGSVDQIFQAILTEPLNMQPLKALEPPHALESLIERCTAKHADRRPPGLGEVRAVLQAVLQGLPPGISQGIQLPLPPAIPQSTPQTAPAPGRSATPVAASERSPLVPAGAMPKFLEMLPAALRTQTGLMLLSCSAVLVVMALVLGILKLTDVI
jgi:eukaryotic-like serine/threonine-protein kinase